MATILARDPFPLLAEVLRKKRALIVGQREWPIQYDSVDTFRILQQDFGRTDRAGVVPQEIYLFNAEMIENCRNDVRLIGNRWHVIRPVRTSVARQIDCDRLNPFCS